MDFHCEAAFALLSKMPPAQSLHTELDCAFGSGPKRSGSPQPEVSVIVSEPQWAPEALQIPSHCQVVKSSPEVSQAAHSQAASLAPQSPSSLLNLSPCMHRHRNPEKCNGPTRCYASPPLQRGLPPSSPFKRASVDAGPPAPGRASPPGKKSSSAATPITPKRCSVPEPKVWEKMTRSADSKQRHKPGGPHPLLILPQPRSVKSTTNIPACLPLSLFLRSAHPLLSPCRHLPPLLPAFPSPLSLPDTLPFSCPDQQRLPPPPLQPVRFVLALGSLFPFL